MARTLATAVLGVLLLGALPATAMARPAAARPHHHQRSARCRKQAGERTLARSREAVVLMSASDMRVHGCSPRSGRRRLLWRGYPENENHWDDYTVMALVGTRVLAVASTGNSHGYVEHDLVLDDVAHRHRRVQVAQGYLDATFPAATLRADGTVAWVAPDVDQQQTVSLRTAHGAVRELDRGLGLGDPRIGRRAVHWRHGDEVRRALLAPPDRCPPGFADGTEALGIASASGYTTFCDRETGTQVTVPGGFFATGGTHAARTTADGITVVDARSGTADTILLPPIESDFVDFDRTWRTELVPAAREVAVDEMGSLVWISGDQNPLSDAPDEVWVRDAAGTHRVAAAGFIRGLHLDGTTASWYQFDVPGTRVHVELAP